MHIPTPDLQALLAAAERAIAAKQELERLAPPPSIDVLLTRRDLVDARRELFDAVWAFDELVSDPTTIAALCRAELERRGEACS
jgi:hypothetical protein